MKDAKGHGSEKRGAADFGDQIRDAQTQRAEGAAAGMSADALAANSLAGGHPKSETVPAHDHFVAQAKASGWALDSRLNKWRHPNSSALYTDSPRWARYAVEDHDSTGHPLRAKGKS